MLKRATERCELHRKTQNQEVRMGNSRSGTHPFVERARQENRIVHRLGIDPHDPHEANEMPIVHRKKKKLGSVSFRAGKQMSNT